MIFRIKNTTEVGDTITATMQPVEVGGQPSKITATFTREGSDDRPAVTPGTFWSIEMRPMPAGADTE